MSVRVACPGCGGAVVFQVGSAMVAVCPHCRSAVARGDRSVENLGKVAELVETGSVLQLGIEGKYEGERFRLVGRSQLQHESGGVWDEWYAAFPNDEWGWLSEAQGRYYMLFEQDQPKSIPAHVELRVGRRAGLEPPSDRFVVNEIGQAKFKGAEGEMPFRVEPAASFSFADLSGPNNAFGTIDYGDEPPTLYLGNLVTLDELQIPKSKRREVHELREIAGQKVSCPQCGGRLELRAPDRTERVGCPYCGSLLDCKQGDLQLLQALKEPPFELVLPLGTVGHFGDDERTVIGALLRSVTFEGKDYFWQEYLLYHPRDGFEWLLFAENHWTRLSSVNAGDIDAGSKAAVFDGQTFKKFRTAQATVRAVIGECYWKVKVGEEAYGAEFINPPLLLTREGSISGSTKEINWNVGPYLTPKEVQTAFNLPNTLPAPRGVAPNQPFGYSGIYKLAGIAIGALLLLGLALAVLRPKNEVLSQQFQLLPLTAAAAPVPPANPAQPPPAPERTQVFFTNHFELKGRRNVKITASCPSLTGWLVVEGDLVEQANGQVQPFMIPLTHYSGVEDGEAWSEGSREDNTYISAQPAGTYSLRLEVEKENAALAGTLTIRVEQGASRLSTWLLTFLGIAIIPLIVGICHIVFNARRWSESDLSGGE